jgi:DNA-binding HxlR family transcriptional regulator
MKAIKEIIRESTMSPLRVDKAITNAVKEEKSNIVKFGRVKTACNPLATEIINTRLKELKEKGYIIVHTKKDKKQDVIYSIEITVLGKSKMFINS